MGTEAKIVYTNIYTHTKRTVINRTGTRTAPRHSHWNKSTNHFSELIATSLDTLYWLVPSSLGRDGSNVIFFLPIFSQRKFMTRLRDHWRKSAIRMKTKFNFHLAWTFLERFEEPKIREREKKTEIHTANRPVQHIWFFFSLCISFFSLRSRGRDEKWVLNKYLQKNIHWSSI